MDIFVCKSGPLRNGIRHNELFINNGDLTFTESSEAWGVADEGLSLHAVFFDYDLDGDLDFYLLNNSNRSVGIFDLREGQRQIPDPQGGNKFYRNEGDHFIEITKEAGIYSSAIGFGLGVSVADVNKDGWPDLFVSNDFFERDYLYINNKDGTFSEQLEEVISEISMGSMGADIADLDNDGFPEIFVTEMLPATLQRVRTKAIFEDWNKYLASVKSGYYHQFSRNVLQRNMGYIPGSIDKVFFSEIGRYSKVHATDWSWGALLFDYNNDGLKDIFVANGIAKDLTDQDYINFYSNTMVDAARLKKDSTLMTSLLNQLPSQKLTNFLYRNDGAFQFESVANQEGLSALTFSNGAAYGDFDNDGAIDLVINNINDPARIYKNKSRSFDKKGTSNYLAIELRGARLNTSGIGAQVTVFKGDNKYYVEQAPVRGYLSSVSHILHLGLGRAEHIDSLIVVWPGGQKQLVNGVNVNQRILLHQDSLKTILNMVRPEIGKAYMVKTDGLLDHSHQEMDFVDFDRNRLLFEMINDGVALALGDVNNDGLTDLFIGGAANFSGGLYVQQTDGRFLSSGQLVFEQDKHAEDTDAIFLDANGDGYQDIYVCSGGKRYAAGSFWLTDRLYLNDRMGNFMRAASIEINGDKMESTSFVRSSDFNNDGLPDLLIGIRADPFKYGVNTNAYLLLNQGNGLFLDVTKTMAPEFYSLGMLSDAAVIDFDADGDLDILFAAEWSTLQYFRNENGKFINSTRDVGLHKFSGKWHSLAGVDVNHDGFPDIVAGNTGLNGMYTGDKNSPLIMYINDFDNNGDTEQIICKQIDGKDFPLALYPDITKQMPMLKKKFTDFDSYKLASVQELFSGNLIRASIKSQINYSFSTVFINERGAKFSSVELPWQAQLTPLYSILPLDLNGDGHTDLLLGGNQTKIKPEWGSINSTFGITLLGKGDGTFVHLPNQKSGFHLRGEIRSVKAIAIGSDSYVLVLRNNDSVLTFKINKP
ncbi:MAG: VCBS repeat-containing protein [Cyclobacteriaceae bacterium]|nr:MAG: VCBS repeat-containing protein [Cyclobacteriaceae bacterium]